jgi:hypothetical protein
MAERYAIFPLDRSILAIDVTEIEPGIRISPLGGETNMVRARRFHRWRNAAAFFAKKGTQPDELEKAWTLVTKGMIAELTIKRRDGEVDDGD